MTKLGKFIGSIIYAVLYLSPIIGNMIWILEARKKRNLSTPVTLGDVMTMLIRYAVFAAFLYWIFK